MDRRAAALAADEVHNWAVTQASEQLGAGRGDQAMVYDDLAEAASDLAHMIRTLDRHLPADG